MTKNTSLVLIAVITAVMVAGALAVAMSTSAFAYTNTNNGGNAAGNGVRHPGHNACGNAGPAAHNPNCQ